MAQSKRKRPKKIDPREYNRIIADYVAKNIRFGVKPNHVFYPGRKWEFDLCWPGLLVALEIEGGIWTGGRHTRPAGFHKDMEKYNHAAAVGWRVFRFTPVEVENGTAREWLLENVFND